MTANGSGIIPDEVHILSRPAVELRGVCMSFHPQGWRDKTGCDRLAGDLKEKGADL